MIDSIKATLQRMEDRYPSTGLNQGNNIWIVKPAGLSRARGIACYSDLGEIIEHIKVRDVDWVIQKYIENPLIIKKRKVSVQVGWVPKISLFVFQELF